MGRVIKRKQDIQPTQAEQNFGRQLKLARERRFKTKTRMTQLSSSPKYSHWESGAVLPSLYKLLWLESFLKANLFSYYSQAIMARLEIDYNTNKGK